MNFQQKTTLLIMAAGIGSRFGGGFKQLAPVDEAGHIIMDYSIHDAIEVGFNKIIFIIRKDIEADFKEVIGTRIEKICQAHNIEVCYAFQSLFDLPEGCHLPEDRQKPWGSGQAVLAAKQWIHEPFAVINADDYYGKQAFRLVHEYLISEADTNKYCMAGFILKNTLSDNGGVTRGICKMDSDGYLTDVVETHNIVKVTENFSVQAKVDDTPIDIESCVSMNMWGLTPQYLDVLECGFREFFATSVPQNPLKAEYLLPIHIGQLVREGIASVKVLKTHDQWFGVTYKEDQPLVVQNIRQLIEDGVYGEELYSDL